MASIKLQSCEGEVFQVDLQTAMVFGTLRTMLLDLNGMSEDENEVIPLKNVSSAILKKLIQWATYHKDEMLIVIDDDRHTVSSWDAEFFNVDQATLFQIILVADYLDIKDLLDAACKVAANMLKSKSTDEMRRRLCIRNDFLPSEEQQVKKETDWYD
ncbi:S-phase kinase-associated protein 1-like [Ixodes scapularis]|uniref:S-phase kinase-associated protein 1-like n=1 Tax=Ixodes scapularis TaxID=6945 RepID=UPI001161B65B|nr:S-phase kinase-associated protein 1-like [Ixodes scapularis]